MLGSYLYSLTWLLAISLELIFYTNITYYPDATFISFLIISALIFITVDKVIKSSYKNYSILNIKRLFNSKKEFIILVFFLFGFFFSSFYFNFQYPFFKIFGLSYLEYNEYGIHGLQGFINACYLSLSTILLYKIIFNKIKLKYTNPILFIIIAYPLILLSRQLIFSLFIQIFLIWLLLSKKSKLKLAFNFLLLFLLGILVFWVMGNFRTGDEVIVSFIGDDADPSYAFLYWPYVYIVSPLSNLLTNIDSTSPNGNLLTLLSQLIPSFIKNFYDIYSDFNGFEDIKLINKNLNMGTYYLPGFLSFGWLGMCISFLLLILIYGYLKIKSNNNIYFFFCYIVLLQVIALSFFTNILFYLPIVFQIFIFIYLGLKK